MGIDNEASTMLRELRPLVAQHIDGILDKAFEWILRFPEVQKVYATIDLKQAKAGQKEHWLNDIFAGEFSEAQFQHSIKICEARQKTGLSLRWYFVFWSMVSSKISEVIAKNFYKKPDHLSKLLFTLSKTVFFDIEIFTAVYINAAEGKATEQLHRHADAFESQVSGLVKGVSASATQLQGTAQAMSRIAEHSATQVQSARTAGDDASNNAQKVAAATDQLSSSIHEITRQVENATRIVNNAVTEAERAGSLVKGLVDGASRIGDVITLIKGVASQTNLLALNATIEAARAGVAGKGFAVVASEVKGLANQTSKATDEISAQIVAVQTVTENAVAAITGIGNVIQQVSDITRAITTAVEQQRLATDGMVKDLRVVVRSSSAANENIRSVHQAIGETGTAAQQVLSGANDLSTQSQHLSTQVEQFLAAVRHVR